MDTKSRVYCYTEFCPSCDTPLPARVWLGEDWECGECGEYGTYNPKYLHDRSKPPLWPAPPLSDEVAGSTKQLVGSYLAHGDMEWHGRPIKRIRRRRRPIITASQHSPLPPKPVDEIEF